jgi:intracellular septation protein A
MWKKLQFASGRFFILAETVNLHIDMEVVQDWSNWAVRVIEEYRAHEN